MKIICDTGLDRPRDSYGDAARELECLPVTFSLNKGLGTPEVCDLVRRHSRKCDLAMAVVDTFSDLEEIKADVTRETIENALTSILSAARLCNTSVVALLPTDPYVNENNEALWSATNLTSLGLAADIADHLLLLKRDCIYRHSHINPQIMQIEGVSRAADCTGLWSMVQFNTENRRIENLSQEVLTGWIEEDSVTKRSS